MGYNQDNHYESSDDSPATQYTWQEATLICDALNIILTPQFHQVDNSQSVQVNLPTEAQWEFACRAGTTEEWFFGNDENELTKYAWYSKDDGLLPKVKLKEPNAWKIYDLYGMVYEWCLDRVMSYEYWTNTVNPVIDEEHAKIKAYIETTPTTNSLISRIARGGCIFDLADECRSSSRRVLADFNSENDLTGIRPVINLISSS